MSHRIWALGAALALSACSAEPDQPAAPQAPEPAPAQISPQTPAPPAADSAPIPGETRGGDGSAIRLTPLTPEEIADASLGGELGCSFTRGGGEAPLLVATGFVGDADGRARALAKIGDYVEPLQAREPGGFDVLADGASFAGRGMTYIVTRTGQEPLAGGESPPYAAEMLLQRADGAEQVLVGRWTCGP